MAFTRFDKYDFQLSIIDPKKWSVEDVRAWLLWNSRQYNLPIPMDLFNITGATLTSMTEQDFQQRAPQVSKYNFMLTCMDS